MPSLLDLVNATLNELGRLPVTAITDGDDSQAIANKITLLAPEILLDYNWNFAVTYVANYSPLTTNFSPDYIYSYALPGNYGKFFKWASTGAQWPNYAIIDGMMLANTLPIQYYYIANDTPFSVWPPLVVRTLVLYAASKIAPAMTNDRSLMAFLEKEYYLKRIDAIRQNDMERSIMSAPYNDFDRVTFV